MTHDTSAPSTASAPTTTTATPTRGSSARFAGLDGLRAIAVVLVLAYHFFPEWLKGGFLGVDVFFVISGFLITSLLLRERERHGRIALGAFWLRRARRLLPALIIVLLVCSSAALAIGGDVLVGIGSQILGTLFFVNNWVSITRGADYFARDNPELFRNTWSLSIEEQFYLLLPLTLLLVIALLRSQTRALPFLVLGIASATWMATLQAFGADPTRIYFGSDSHTFGLLFGAALAVSLHAREQRCGGSAPPVASLARQWVWIAATALGFAILGWLAATLREGSPQSFEGGFQLATLATLLVVWGVTRPGSWVGRALDVAPLRWIGERSYGIYLWHWPVLVLLVAVPNPWAPNTGGATFAAFAALAITLALAILSYRYVEQPIRRGGFWHSMRALWRRLPDQSFGRATAWVLVALVVVTVPLTVTAAATAPARSATAEHLLRAKEQADAARAAAGSSSTSPSPTPSPTPSPSTQPPTPTADPTPPPITGDQVWAVGDSVMLASSGALSAAFPGIVIDADVSRSFNYGASIVATNPGYRPVVVLGVATNGPLYPQDIDLLDSIGTWARIVLVNAHGDRWWIPEINQALADYAASHRGVVLADWNTAIAAYPDYLAGDGIHPGESGAEIYAQVVAQAFVALGQKDELPAR